MREARVRSLEERGFNAWPALQTLSVGGWLLRLSGGHTKRANSASALSPCAGFEEVRRAAEAVFARHGLPTVFRLSPLAPRGTDAALHRAGYRALDPSLVLTAAVGGGRGPDGVRLAEAPGPGWLEGFARAAGLGGRARPLHDAMLSAIALPAAFASVHEDGRAVGFGLGVHERGRVGVFDVVVAAEHRRRGHAGAITRALLAWGHGAGAREAYLQVGEANEAARRLYAGLGFGEAYRYHYRRRDPGGAGEG